MPSRKLNKSQGKILNRNGLKIDDCGTPYNNSHHELYGSPTFTLCFLYLIFLEAISYYRENVVALFKES